MPDPALEDFSVGDMIVGEPLTVTRDDIVGFAKDFDFQPFHLDEAAAETTFAGRLIGSGWHTAALGMRLLQQGPFRGGSSLGAPGIDELRWLAPVLPGDALTLTFRVAGLRDSATKPGLGFVTAELALGNQRAETVLTQRFTFMLARRGTDPAPAAGGDRRAGAGRRAGGCRDPALPAGCRDRGRARPGRLPVHRRGDRGLRAGLRSAGLPPRPRRGQAQPFRRPLRLRLAHDRRLHEPDAHDPRPGRRLHGQPRAGAGGRALPGFKNLRWLKPVYAGDTVRFSAKLTDKRASASRPGWGLAFARNTGVNQRGEAVFAFDSAVFHRWEP